MAVRGPDTRIPLMAQPAERIDPFQSFGKILAIKEMQRREETDARKLRQEQELEALAAQYGDDPDELVKQLGKRNPLLAATLGEKLAQSRKEQFQAYGEKLENETKGFELATRELQSIPDGDVPTMAAWRSRWVTRDPQLDKLLPPPEALATPQVKQHVLGLGMSTVEFNKAKVEATKAFINGDYMKLGNVLASAPSLEAADAIIAEAEQALPKSVINHFKTIRANTDGLAAFQAAAGNAALTEKDRLDLQGKAVDDQRQAEAAAEARRHNAATEAISRGHLGVSQAQLGIARERLAQDKKTGAAGGVKLSAAQETEMADMMTVETLADDVLKLGREIKWSGVGGMYQGTLSQFGARHLGMGTKDEETLRNNIGNVLGTIAKIRGGTAFTDAEKALMETYTPTINDSPLQLEAKLSSLKTFIKNKRQNLLKVASGDYTSTGATTDDDRDDDKKSVTRTELAAIAKRRGTSVNQEEKRATEAGYIVR